MKGELTRIMVQRIPGAKKQKYRALTEAGEVLTEASEAPYYEGALALLRRGANPESPVTMRHEGHRVDSFRPSALCLVARLGEKVERNRLKGCGNSRRDSVEPVQGNEPAEDAQSRSCGENQGLEVML